MSHEELIMILNSLDISIIQSKRERLLDIINYRLDREYERGSQGTLEDME